MEIPELKIYVEWYFADIFKLIDDLGLNTLVSIYGDSNRLCAEAITKSNIEDAKYYYVLSYLIDKKVKSRQVAELDI